MSQFSVPLSLFGPNTGASTAGIGDFATLGYATMLVGAIAEGVGAFYTGAMVRERGKMVSDQLRFQETTAAINARSAERDAQLALEAGTREIGRLTLGVGAAKAAKRAQTAAAGLRVDAGGSGAEVEASLELLKQIDTMTVRRNAVREASAHRTRRTNFRNEGLLAGVSADNVRRSTDAMSPATDAAVALLDGASDVALNLSRDRMLASYIQTI